jgi:succinate dehydrogenase/fumarate reductase flavoprotein subunit
MSTQSNPDDGTPPFDEEFDVIVAGYGFAGALAAITAADAGCRVLLAEKAENPGGISICSGGAMRSAHDADKAFEYLKATNGGRTPDDINRVLADGMATMEEEVRGLAAASGATVTCEEKGGNYPFPGHETFYHTVITHVPGHETQAGVYPHIMARPSANGWKVFRVLEDNIDRRDVEVRYRFPARRLITNAAKEVVGATFENAAGKIVTVKARRAVILCTGGFEADEAMKLQFWEKAPVLTATSTNNTGDGIRMAQALGADLWHMWHFHGSYGFKHPDPDYPVAIRVKRLPDWMPGQEDKAKAPMCWIVVDRAGRRYMNECTPYTHDTSHRPMEYFDTVTQTFPRIPSYLIYDQEGCDMYQIGAPTYNQPGLGFAWSEDNMAEVEMGIVRKADTVAALAGIVGADAATLRASLDRWNALVEGGKDADFGRPPGTMATVREPPFYVGEVWPVVSNTQGGPIHDTRQRIIDVFGEPIPRLYAAGELGSAFGFLYLSGANLSECLITGRIAGSEAAGLAAWG